MLTDQLLAALRPLIGFRADPLSTTGKEELPESLTKTKTGITLDQCHELLKLSTIRAVAPQGLEKFNEYLAESRDDSIRALLTNLDTRLAEAGLSPQLLNTVTYPVPNLIGTPIPKGAGRQLGLVLKPKQIDVLVPVHRIRLFGAGVLATPLTLTLHHEADPAPLATIQIDKANTWLDIELPALSKGYTYYLLYEEDDLGDFVAHNTLNNWPKPKSGCVGCKQACASHYVDGKAIQFFADGSGPRQAGAELTNTNFGLSLVISAAGDVSGRLLNDPRRLLTALRYQLAVSFLEKIAFSKRKNPVTEDAVNGALFALTDKNNSDRVPPKLDKALSALVKALQAEASVSLDVNEQDEITWGTL